MRFYFASIALALAGASLSAAEYVPPPPEEVHNCHHGYEPARIDFEQFDKGDYVYHVGHGVIAHAAGVPFGKKYTPLHCGRHQPDAPIGCPRIFDSSHPTGKDYDLGTPNDTFYGPGWGLGGEKGRLGENALPRRNVLIMQESDKAAPDDSRDGGALMFFFPKPAYIQEVGLLDLESSYILFGLTPSYMPIYVPPSLGLGDNSFEAVSLGPVLTTTFTLGYLDSGAITHLNLCFKKDHRRLRSGEAEEGNERDLQEEVDTSFEPVLVDMAMKFVEDPDNLDTTGWTPWDEIDGEDVVPGE